MKYADWLREAEIIAKTYRQVKTYDPAPADIAHMLYRRAFERDRWPTLDDAMAEWTGEQPPTPPAPPTPPPTPDKLHIPSGAVSLDNRAMRDAGGFYLPLGASLFWAVRGAVQEPDRVLANMRWLRERGVDFIRVFAETSDWGDKATDPRQIVNYRSYLRLVVEMAETLGLRIAWTIFGGNQLAVPDQQKCAEDVLAVCLEKPHTVQYVEISNENNGKLTARDYERYGGMFKHAGFVTAFTSAAHTDRFLYNSAGANVATVHFERRAGDRGWRFVRQPWGYPGEYGEYMPRAFINNEPIGPGTSVNTESDPLKLAMGAVNTWICGGCAHVVHFGAGIFGVPSDHPIGGHRPANVWEQPGLAEILQKTVEYRDLLPGDLPNWKRTRHGFTDHPYDFPPRSVGDDALADGKGCVRAYAAFKDGRYVMSLIGIMGRFEAKARHAAFDQTYDQANGEALVEFGLYT